MSETPADVDLLGDDDDKGPTSKLYAFISVNLHLKFLFVIDKLQFIVSLDIPL